MHGRIAGPWTCSPSPGGRFAAAARSSSGTTTATRRSTTRSGHPRLDRLPVTGDKSPGCAGTVHDAALRSDETVRDTLGASGRGAGFGRNTWQSPEPARMVEALRQLSHEDGAV